MDITWYGLSCFRIVERGETVIATDPYSDTIGLPPLKVKADVVTVSHDVPGHNAVDNVKGYQSVLSGPGEYEIGGVFITGIAMHTIDEEKGLIQPNVAYMYTFVSGLTVLHLGDLAHLPDQSTIEELGEINVLMVPVGGGNSLRATAASEMIALVEPNFIIPMHYDIPGLAMNLDPVDRFLKAMGVSKWQEEDFLRLNATDLPEQPQVVVLTPQLKSGS